MQKNKIKLINNLGYVKKLRTKLLKDSGYDPMSIPVKNFSHTLNVEFDYNIMNILSLVNY